jgi:hypothetical protein
MMTIRTLGPWLHDRGFSRQAKNTNIQKTADSRTKNENKTIQKHRLISNLFSYFVVLVL